MSKYIDAEKLKAEVEKRREDIKAYCLNPNHDKRYDVVPEQLAYILDIIDSLQQEQQEVDLEKFTDKIKTFQGRYKHPEIVSIKGAMAFMARMFYQYPNIARQWYNNLPKITMD